MNIPIPLKKQLIAPKAIIGTNEERLTPIATVAPTTIDKHTNRSSNKETDNAKQSISTAAMVNVSLRTLFGKETRAGLAASICRTSNWINSY